VVRGMWYVVWYSIPRRAEEVILTAIIEESSISNYVSDLRGELNCELSAGSLLGGWRHRVLRRPTLPRVVIEYKWEFIN